MMMRRSIVSQKRSGLVKRLYSTASEISLGGRPIEEHASRRLARPRAGSVRFLSRAAVNGAIGGFGNDLVKP
jgi:hypothetical protein